MHSLNSSSAGKYRGCCDPSPQVICPRDEQCLGRRTGSRGAQTLQEAFSGWRRGWLPSSPTQHSPGFSLPPAQLQHGARLIHAGLTTALLRPLPNPGVNRQPLFIGRQQPREVLQLSQCGEQHPAVGPRHRGPRAQSKPESPSRNSRGPPGRACQMLQASTGGGCTGGLQPEGGCGGS